MTRKLRRSFLHTPADSPSRMRKAARTDADTVVLDLEDPVPDDRKAEARDNVREIVSDVDFGDTEVSLRMNGLRSEFWAEDLRLIADIEIDSVKIAMVSSAWEVQTAVETVQQYTSDPPAFMLVIESPRGLFSCDEIATLSRDLDPVEVITFGAADYSQLIGAPGIPDRIREFIELHIVSYAAIGNLTPVTTGYLDIDDQEGLRETATRGRELGFTGMTAIHPAQIDVINDVFTPSREAYEEARDLVAAFDDADEDSLMVDGIFLDNAVVERYRNTVRRYERIHDVA